MGITLSYIVIILGVILVVLSFILFKRKGEAELSRSIANVPIFWVGAVAVVIGTILRLFVFR